MAFSCQLVDLPILPRDSLKYLFSSALSRYLTLDLCTNLNLRCQGFYSSWNYPIRSTGTQVTSETTRTTIWSTDAGNGLAHSPTLSEFLSYLESEIGDAYRICLVLLDVFFT